MGRLIPVRVGDVEIEVEALAIAGTEATSGGAERAAAEVRQAFQRAQDTIVEVAKSTAAVIEKAGRQARPDRMDVEFGLTFSVSGGVVLVGASGAASLKVTLSYDRGERLGAGCPPESTGEAGSRPETVAGRDV